METGGPPRDVARGPFPDDPAWPLDGADDDERSEQRRVVQLARLIRTFEARRETLGLTKEEVSLRAGLGVRRYGQISLGAVWPDFTSLARIAEVLDVELYGGPGGDLLPEAIELLGQLPPEQLSTVVDLLRALQR